jgi:glutamate 5-kinase
MQQRFVIKIGSSSLTSDNGGLNRERIRYFAQELALLQQAGHQVVLVTSGAVAAGFRELGFDKRPKLLHEKQASAAVGQALLMQAYQEELLPFGIGAGQILLTRSDFMNRTRIQNAQLTMEELLKHHVIPIINENDTVSINELKFGDNDMLSALVANLLKANQLLICTDTDGLYSANPKTNPNAVRYEQIDTIDEQIYAIAGGSSTDVGTGGMRTKIDAARIATKGGIPVFIGVFVAKGDMLETANGKGKGTYFPTTQSNLSMKKQWVGFHSPTRGTIVIDEGAVHALLKQNRSLLPAGVKQSTGDFHPGDVVAVTNDDGQIIGRGIVNYTSQQLLEAAGLSTEEVIQKLDVARIEVIHRDEWLSLT